MIVESYSGKLMVLGLVICVGGIAIAIIKTGVGQPAVAVGTIIAISGIGMAVHGWLRRN